MRYDVIIVGAGAAGLMCAIRASEKNLSVLIIDKSEKAGKKILISGGGRCNFTNLNIDPIAYLSPNKHFCKSALSRYTQWHFIKLLTSYQLTYHEKTLGQLFCDQKSSAVVDMLVSEATENGVTFEFNNTIESVKYADNNYVIQCEKHRYYAKNFVVACGGPSFAKLGASDFASQLAKQFKLKNTPFVPALVPFTLSDDDLLRCQKLAGVTAFVNITCNGISFKENILFTHRGVSGPAILQISSYWNKGDDIQIDFFPDEDILALLVQAKKSSPQKTLSALLSEFLPNKLVEVLIDWRLDNQQLQSYSNQMVRIVSEHLRQWNISPSGTEGMKKAEVCTGGIHPDELSSKTMESKKQPKLYVIGEAVDVTGWLGGYNFQWAWSSGWCCGDSLEKTNSPIVKQ